MKTILLLFLTISSCFSLEGDFYIKEIGMRSVTLAPAKLVTPLPALTVRENQKHTSSMTAIGGGGGYKPKPQTPAQVKDSKVSKSSSPLYVAVLDNLNIQFEMGYVFHATYSIDKTVGKYTVITISKYSKFNYKNVGE